MKLILYLVIVMTLMQSCASNKSRPNPNPKPITKLKVDPKIEGMSFESAIVVNSISEEYRWIRVNYPGSRVSMQALSQNKGKPYDIISIITDDNYSLSIYFDISSFFGKNR